MTGRLSVYLAGVLYALTTTFFSRSFVFRLEKIVLLCMVFNCMNPGLTSTCFEFEMADDLAYREKFSEEFLIQGAADAF